jgi:hypothetical protein
VKNYFGSHIKTVRPSPDGNDTWFLEFGFNPRERKNSSSFRRRGGHISQKQMVVAVTSIRSSERKESAGSALPIPACVQVVIGD